MPCLLPMAKQYISFDHIRKEGGCEDNETLYENYLSNFKLRESKKYGILYFVYKFNFGCFTPKKLDDKILFTLFEYATFNSFKTASEKGYNPDRIGVSFSYDNVIGPSYVEFEPEKINNLILSKVYKYMAYKQERLNDDHIQKLQLIIELKDPKQSLRNKISNESIMKAVKEQTLCPCCAVDDILDKMAPNEDCNYSSDCDSDFFDEW